MANFERKVLVLDSRYEPVKVVSLEVGFVLLFTKRAQPVIESERKLRGVNQIFSVPWILRLGGCTPKSRLLSSPRFSRHNVYLRDGYRCQYCNWTGPTHNLTLDHLIPASRGGKTTWENVVTACRICNHRKGARTPEELGMRLLHPPIRPFFRPTALFALRFGLNRSNIPESWVPFVDLSATDRLSQLLDASRPLKQKSDGDGNSDGNGQGVAASPRSAGPVAV